MYPTFKEAYIKATINKIKSDIKDAYKNREKYVDKMEIKTFEITIKYRE